MATTTHQLASTFFVCSAHATYSNAREKTNADVFTNESPWVGQYLSARHEVNQVFAAYDLSSIPAGATITSAKLTITVAESYGTFDLEIRASDWDGSNSLTSFVAGSALASKTLLGSRSITGPYIGTFDVTLSNVTRANLEKMVFASAAQRTGTPTTNDDTARLDNAVLEVTWTPPAPNKELIITTTGAGSWTPPAGVFEVWVGVHGGGGAGAYSAAGGGGAWSGGDLSVTPGVARNYYVAAPQPYARNGAATVGQDSWFGSATTIMAKGANGHVGGAATSGFGPTKYSGGSTQYVNPDTGLPYDSNVYQTNGGSGAAASRYGDGSNGFYNGRDIISTGGTSPGGGSHPGTDHVEGGGGFGPSNAYQEGTGGSPGGGSRTSTSTRGQIIIRWYEADTTVYLNGSVSLGSPKVAASASHNQPRSGAASISLSTPRVQSSSTFTEPARTGAGTISLAPMVAAAGQSIVPAVGEAGVSLRAPRTESLGSFTAHPAPPSSGGGSGETVTEKFKTAGTFDWTVPAGVTAVTAKVWGPGGNGADGAANRAGGGAGGGGFRQATNYPVTPGQVISFRVGSPGTSSYFVSTAVCQANSGGNGAGQGPGSGGSHSGSATGFGYNGGSGNWGGGNSSANGGGAGSSASPTGNGAANLGSDGENRGGPGQYGIYAPPGAAGPGFQPGGGGGGGATNNAGGAGGVGQVFLEYVAAPAVDGNWLVGVIALKGPFTSGEAGQNTQGAVTVSLTAPKAELQSSHGVSFNGSISLASPSVQGSGSHTRVGSGVIVLSSPVASGSGAHGVAGSSAISLSSPSASGSGSHSRVGSGVVALSVPMVVANGQHKVGAQGLVKLGSPTVTAYASRGALVSSSVTLTAPTVMGEATHAIGATASVILSNPRAEGQADHGVGGSGSVALTGPFTEAFAETFNEAISTVQIGAPAVAAEAHHGVAGDGQVSLSAPTVEADGSHITGAYSAVRLSSPTVAASSDHGVAGSSSITLAQPVVDGAGSLQPQGVGAISLWSPKAAGLMSQGGFARVSLKGPSVEAQGGHGASVHGIITLTAPSASGEAAAGATGQGNANLPSPSITALAKRGTASSAAIPLGLRVAGSLTHSVAAGGMVSLTVLTDGLANHGVAGEGAITLIGPMTAGDAAHGLAGEGAISLVGPSAQGLADHGVEGAATVSLIGPMVEGALHVDLATVYGAGSVMLGSPGVKGRVLTLPTHGQRTVFIDGELRVVAPVNEARSLNIGQETRAVVVSPE